MGKQKAGIYGLYNVMEDKLYIGASANIEQRFATHKANFQSHSGRLSMYEKPLEDFVFFILFEMPQDAFEKFGNMMERLFIEKAKFDGIPLYNKNCLTGSICSVFEAFGMMDTIQDAILDKCGTRRAWIKMMGEKSRANVLDHIRKEREGES